MSVIRTITNPYNGDVVRSVHLLTQDDMDAAIARSETAFSETRRVPAYQRAALLRGLADAVAQDAEVFAQAIMREAGKPIVSARGEVQRAVATLTGSAEEATRLFGETLPLDTAAAGAGRIGITKRVPIGPIAGISPFNFPLNLGLHKVGPALAAGNTILWKPPLQAPGAAILFAERFAIIAEKLDFPKDSMQVILAEDTVAESLVTDPRVKMLSFTGSAKVGWNLRAKAAKKRSALELGGNAAVIIAPDADLEYAAQRCAEGGYGYAGQVCIAVQRIIVHESIYAEFIDKYLRVVKNLRVGDPADERTHVGPMISQKEADRVAAWIDEAISGGAKKLCGGERDGLMISPTIFTDADPSLKIVSEEVFGPVTTVEPYSEWPDAFATVNTSKYGLQAGIFTNDLPSIMAAFDTLEVGTLIAGDIPTFRIDTMPYGGVKDSGIGREGMRYAIKEMTEERLLVLPSL